ncbi:MAG: hypothetical protein AAGG72_07295, partial [Pseudomonadota bacterium]
SRREHKPARDMALATRMLSRAIVSAGCGGGRLLSFGVSTARLASFGRVAFGWPDTRFAASFDGLRRTGEALFVPRSLCILRLCGGDRSDCAGLPCLVDCASRPLACDLYLELFGWDFAVCAGSAFGRRLPALRLRAGSAVAFCAAAFSAF